MSKFTFGGLKTTTPKKHKNTKVVNYILYKSTTYSPDKEHLIFITELPEKNKLKLKSFIIWIQKQTGMPFIILSATDLKVPLETLKADGIVKFYKNNSSNYAEFINNNSILLPMGRALLGVNGDDNVYLNCFTDFLFGNTQFYNKQYNCYIYPIFGLDDIIILENTYYRPRRWSKTNFSAHQIQLATKEKLTNCSPPREPKIIKLNTKEEVSNFLKKHTGIEEKVSWDLETDGVDFRKNNVGCITLSFDGCKGYYIPWRLIKPEELNEFFIGKKGIGSNCKFDVRMLRKYGITNAEIYCDTLNLGHVINENRKNGLKSLAYHYTMFGGYDEELDHILSTMKDKNFLSIPEPILAQYATMDAIIAFQIYKAMDKQLNYIDSKFINPHFPQWTLRKYFEKIVMPWVRLSAEIEIDGVHVDMDHLAKSSKILRDKIKNIKNKLCTLLNTDSKSLTSVDKLGELLEKQGWKNLGRTKKGFYKTNDICLDEWEKQGHQEATLLKQMRTLLNFYSTHVGSKEDGKGWYQYIHDKKLNPQYSAMLAETGRNRCKSPNYQAFPSHGKDKNLVTHSITTPDDGEYKFLTIDYSGLQIRLCAIESQDPVLTDIYKNNRNGGDLHSITGYNIFCSGKSYDIDKYNITLEDGSEISLYGYEKIKIKRDNKELTIQVWDLQKEDDIISY